MTGLEILGLVLLILAFVFIGIECLIPGFGAPGIVGAICLIIGIALSVDTWQQAMILTAILAVVLAIFIFVMLRLLHSGKLRSPIVLKEKLDKERGFISSEDLNYLVGREGKAVTDLRPAGKISVDDLVLDVISSGAYIESGANVRITGVSNSSLVVQKTDRDA